ncbi:MAG: energy transducer TonB [Pseudomonadota bacterium]
MASTAGCTPWLEGWSPHACIPATDTLPEWRSGKYIVYPVTRLLDNDGGFALAEFRVSADGRVSDIRNIDNNYHGFYVHTKDAIQNWELLPATQDGQPVAVTCRHIFSFGERIGPPDRPEDAWQLLVDPSLLTDFDNDGPAVRDADGPRLNP